jgi:hypothetical protein
MRKNGEELKKFKKQTSVENEESTEVYISNFMKSQNQTSRSPENKLQEVYISNPNNTNLSDTEMNDNKSNQIISAWMRKDLIAITALRIIRLMKTLSKRPLIMNHWK